MATQTTSAGSDMSTVDRFLAAFPLLGLVYLVVGLVWADQHMAHLNYTTGTDLWFSWLGEVVAWPLLVFVDVNVAGLSLQ